MRSPVEAIVDATVADVAQLAVREDRVVVHDRTAVVRPRDVGRGQHRDDTWQGTDRVEVDGFQRAVRDRREAERAVQRAGEFGQVVDVGRGAGDVQVRRFVRPADADLRVRIANQVVSSACGWMMTVAASARRLQCSLVLVPSTSECAGLSTVGSCRTARPRPRGTAARSAPRSTPRLTPRRRGLDPTTRPPPVAVRRQLP